MFEKFLFKKVEMWIVLFILLISALAALFFGWGVRHYHIGNKHLGVAGEIFEEIASIPGYAKKIFFDKVLDDRAALLASQQRFAQQRGFLFNYQPGDRPDLGYVLVNRYDGDLAISVSELVDLNSQEVIHQWRFVVDSAWQQSQFDSAIFDVTKYWRTKRFRNQHALLLADGSVIARAVSPILKVDHCSNVALFSDGALYHHSIEVDHNGNYWMPNLIEPKSVTIGSGKFHDDGIVQISPQGEVLFEKSIIEILEENNLGYMIYGDGTVSDDPVHLNDIQPVVENGSFWSIGDLFLSVRNKSMVLLYRPSTNQVIWHHEGPWLHQHDVDILDDHRIAIFDNHAKLQGDGALVVDGHSNEYIFDFAIDKISTPFDTAFEQLDIRTSVEGRGEIIKADEMLVEETVMGRLIYFNSNADVIWQYINRSIEGDVYTLNWSRMISRSLGDQVRKIVKREECNAL